MFLCVRPVAELTHTSKALAQVLLIVSQKSSWTANLGRTMRPTKEHSVRISDREVLEWSDAGDRHSDKSRDDLERIAHWMDTVFEVPILGWRFGVDALLGLIPGIGDTASTFASIYILQAATKVGISRMTVARMTLNIVVDLLVGSLPFVGDLFDVYWKANRRNVALLRRHLEAAPTAQAKLNRADSVFVISMIALILIVFATSLAAAYFILSRAATMLMEWK